MILFPVYIFVTLVFLNRYVAGILLKRLKDSHFDQVIEDFQPAVTVVTPLFNEGRGICDCIYSVMEQNYPADRLNMIVVDDCSTDDSYEWACRAAAQYPDRVMVLKNSQNVGKRLGIIRAVRAAESEIIVSVDSDVTVEKHAIGRLVSRFIRRDIAAVGGRVNVRNANENWITRMQVIRYYFAYEYLKNLEKALYSVMCLSGCLTAYRRDVLLELEPVLLNRNFLGVPIKYGEDRFLTHQIIKAGYQTFITLDAVCWTIAPNTLKKFWSQQLRWRRSSIADFLASLTYVWRLNPLVTLHYLSLFAMYITYPVMIAFNILTGAFWVLAVFHIGVLVLLSSAYFVGTQTLPKEQRVHPLWFLPMAIVMPVTYLLFTPLALFTLDSSSWETRQLKEDCQCKSA